MPSLPSMPSLWQRSFYEAPTAAISHQTPSTGADMSSTAYVPHPPPAQGVDSNDPAWQYCTMPDRSTIRWCGRRKRARWGAKFEYYSQINTRRLTNWIGVPPLLSSIGGTLSRGAPFSTRLVLLRLRCSAQIIGPAKRTNCLKGFTFQRLSQWAKCTNCYCNPWKIRFKLMIVITCLSYALPFYLGPCTI